MKVDMSFLDPYVVREQIRKLQICNVTNSYVSIVYFGYMFSVEVFLQ